MKLIIAIVNHDDANAVTRALTQAGFSSTKLSTTGGFLMAGNATILIGVDEEKVQQVIDVIRDHSFSRKQMIPTTTEMSYGYYPSMPVEVTVGGATVSAQSFSPCLPDHRGQPGGPAYLCGKDGGRLSVYRRAATLWPLPFL